MNQPGSSLSFLLVAFVLLGCDEDPPAAANDGVSAPASSALAVATSASPDESLGLRPGRRPAKSYILAHGATECVVYWEEGDRRSKTLEVRCPRELERGERIRLSGRVCFRQGNSRERDEPVRCPVDLVDLQRSDTADAGG